MLPAFALAAGFTVLLCHAQMRAEEARREAVNRYRVIFEDAISGIYETTLDGRYATANPKLAEMFGYLSPAELIREAENLNRMFYVKPNRRAAFARIVEERGSIVGFESEIYRRDGSRIWITENAVAVRDSAGRLTGFQGTTIEITDRKLAQAALQQANEELEQKVIERTGDLERANAILRDEINEVEDELRCSEEKFRNLVEATTDWIWETDAQGVYTYASPKIKELIGFEPEEIVGKRPYDLMPSAEAARVKRVVLEMTAAGKGLNLLESVQYYKNGSLVTSETSSVPFYDADGKICGARGIARDITDRKRAESMLEASEKRYRELVENARDVIYTHDLEGRYTSLNRTGEQIFGCTREEVRELKAGDVIAPEYLELARQMTAAKLGGEDLTVYEIEAVTRSGQRIPLEESSWLNFDENGEPVGVQGIARDIAERKRSGNELLASQKQLRELSAHLQSVREEERKNLARELHNEFGQSMTALKIELVRLGDKLPKSGGSAQKKVAAENRDRILAMIEIVDTAMETIRKIVSELRPGVLDELGLAAALEWQTQQFQKRTGINCDVRIEFEEPAACSTLKTTVFRILQECLTNIIRHADAGNVRITLRDDEWRIFFEVEDDGRGIDREQIENRSAQSFGILGMSERALTLNGTVEIGRAGENGGTRVTVSIPRPRRSAAELL